MSYNERVNLFVDHCPAVKDLISGCLQADVTQRLTLDQVVAHPWLHLHDSKKQFQHHQTDLYYCQRFDEFDDIKI